MRSDELWSGIRDVYEGILTHPFIKGLTDGSLPLEKFKYYIIQDYHYLKEFAKALALLSAKAEKSEERELFATHVTHALDVERVLHQGFTKEWGINPEEYEVSPTNLLYTSYLISVVYSRPFYEGVAAVLPCYWIYMEVGKELKRMGSANKFYQKWIDTYGGEEYEKGVRAVIQIIDGFEVTKEQEENMMRHFRTASIFEYMFWDSAYKIERFPFSLKRAGY